ncbi:cyclin-like protein interacting with PHO85 [Basidiobolus ranarum]|uniref:Cyclin-like protein interacting with PHO85 n=1 Tax=Basidiobolus ranarum TaxID=34480 RepID=A0ABR2WXL4_9FUNG
MKTFDLANFPTSDTVTILSNFLDRLTKVNSHLVTPLTDPNTDSLTCPSYTPFHAKSLPNIDIHLYLSRILKYCPCSNECFLALLVYFDRMAQFKDEARPHKRPFAIDAYNVHRLVIVGIMVASKFFSDVYYTNVRYAKVGGIPVKELNVLELEFLRLNQYQMNVSVTELQLYADQLLNFSTVEKSFSAEISDERTAKQSVENEPVSATSVTNIHAQKIGSTQESSEEYKRSTNPLILMGRKPSEKNLESPLSKSPRRAHIKSKRNKWNQDWCHTRFPSQRTVDEGHVASPVH